MLAPSATRAFAPIQPTETELRARIRDHAGLLEPQMTLWATDALDSLAGVRDALRAAETARATGDEQARFDAVKKAADGLAQARTSAQLVVNGLPLRLAGSEGKPVPRRDAGALRELSRDLDAVVRIQHGALVEQAAHLVDSNGADESARLADRMNRAAGSELRNAMRHLLAGDREAMRAAAVRANEMLVRYTTYRQLLLQQSDAERAFTLKECVPNTWACTSAKALDEKLMNRRVRAMTRFKRALQHEQRIYARFIVSGRHSDLAMAESEQALSAAAEAKGGSALANALGEAHRLLLHQAYALNLMGWNNPQYLLVEDGKSDHVAEYMAPRQETYAAHRARYAKLLRHADAAVKIALPLATIPEQPWDIVPQGSKPLMMKRPPGPPLYGAGEDRPSEQTARPGSGGR